MNLFLVLILSLLIGEPNAVSAPPAAPNPLPAIEKLRPEADVLVYVFLAARCPCSQAHEPVIRDLAKKYGGIQTPRKIQFIGIHSNQNESENEGRARWTKGSENILGFPVYRDSDLQVANAFGAVKTPHVFVVDRKSKSILYQGGIDDSSQPENARKFFLQDLLEALQQGKTPEFRETRVLGCRIERDS